MESYKDKIIRFNRTEKYLVETTFLSLLIEAEYNSHLILDWGCGCGFFMDKYGTDGYDVNEYYDSPDNGRYYLNYVPNIRYKHIVMNHVIAHIPNTVEVLKDLKQRYNATITVITPNKDWLDPDYNNDPTVIKHYTQDELKELFVSCGYEVTLLGQFGELKNGVNERIFLQAK